MFTSDSPFPWRTQGPVGSPVPTREGREGLNYSRSLAIRLLREIVRVQIASNLDYLVQQTFWACTTPTRSYRFFTRLLVRGCSSGNCTLCSTQVSFGSWCHQSGEFGIGRTSVFYDWVVTSALRRLPRPRPAQGQGYGACSPRVRVAPHQRTATRDSSP